MAGIGTKLPALLLDHRVDTVDDHPARGVALGAGIGQADLRPYTEGEDLLLAEKTIAEAPVFGAVLHHQEEERAPVADLALLRFGLGVSDDHQNWWSVGKPVQIPSERYLKKRLPSHLRDDHGRHWMGKMVQKRTKQTSISN
uniref:hypothetical protein n=1 Tax=Sphingomonas sp. OTU376 TaxID=3043863 RepID=UPI00313B6292